MRDEVLLAIVAVICLTLLALTFFVVMRRDSTVLISVSSAIGGIVGYAFRFARERRRR